MLFNISVKLLVLLVVQILVVHKSKTFYYLKKTNKGKFINNLKHNVLLILKIFFKLDMMTHLICSNRFNYFFITNLVYLTGILKECNRQVEGLKIMGFK